MMLRSCIRCGGDLYLERLSGSEDLVCLQCGFRKTVERPSMVGRLIKAA
jgi:DNA-directed RNA polymerase subunit RPC12/RpoP